MTDIANMNNPAEKLDTVASRIEARLITLHKNPSSVALEAGLGRSSVRDILVGKVSSPRLETLKRLTGPLECSLEYLTGSSDFVPDSEGEMVTVPAEPLPPRYLADFDVVEVVGIPEIQIGVFRTPEATFDDDDPRTENQFPKEKHLNYSDLRLTNHHFELFRIVDSSLEDINIISGDLLTVARPRIGLIPLKRGTVVLVRRFLNADETAIEMSARYVDIIDGDVTLTSRSKNPKYRPIPLGPLPEHLTDRVRALEELRPDHYITHQGVVHIWGIVVRVTRQLSV